MTSKKIVAIIVPTFNERDNIARLIKSIRMNANPHDKIIVVDDNSPDGTGKVVEGLAKKQKNIYLVLRQNKSGRGSAVLDGFKFAQKFKPSFYIEMDADFSHKPEDIPRLLKAVEEADVVIGSRYLKGARIINWSIKRKVFSKLANIYAKIILKVPIADYTNGFRIYKKEAVNFLLSQKLVSFGYILLSETAYKLKEAGFTFREIPIVFVNRKRGASNLNFAEIKNAFFGVWQTRFTKPS